MRSEGGPINSGTIVEGSLISEGKGSNPLQAVLLPYLEVPDVTLFGPNLSPSALLRNRSRGY